MGNTYENRCSKIEAFIINNKYLFMPHLTTETVSFYPFYVCWFSHRTVIFFKELQISPKQRNTEQMCIKKYVSIKKKKNDTPRINKNNFVR